MTHARLAARRYYVTRWLAGYVRHLIMVPVVRDIGRRQAARDKKDPSGDRGQHQTKGREDRNLAHPRRIRKRPPSFVQINGQDLFEPRNVQRSPAFPDLNFSFLVLFRAVPPVC